MPPLDDLSADSSWYHQLPDGPDNSVSPPGQLSVNVTGATTAPTGRMVVRPNNPPQKPDDSWYHQLPEPPENIATQKPDESATAPVSGAVPDAAASKGPDLPEWAGGRSQTAVTTPTPPPAVQPSWSNIAEAIPSGLYEGVARVPNIPSDALNMASGVMKGLTGQDYGHTTPPFNINPTNYQPVGGLATGLHDASSAASNTLALGGAARMITPMLPTGSAASIASHALESPSKGVVAAAGAGGAAEEPVASHVPEPYRPIARFGANIVTGGGVAAAERGVAHALTGSSVSPEAAQLAQLGRDTYQLPIRGGQISGNRLVRTADSALKSVPFSGHGALDEEAQGAFNSAVARTMGEDAKKITPQVMNAARTRIGGVLENIETRNNVNFDPPLVNDLAAIESNARSSLTDPEFAVIKRQLDGVMQNVNGNDQVSGQTYGNLMHKGAPLDAAANSNNSNVSSYAGQIKEALRGSLQRSLSGDDIAAYQTARTQWKNMRTIEPLTLRADVVGGASPATGDIIPAQLRGAVNHSYGNAAFANPGDVPLNDLANIGQRFLKELPSSQTSERNNFMKWLERGGALVGAAVGGEHYLGISPASVAVPAAIGAGASLGVAKGISARLRSDSFAKKMISEGLGNAPKQTAAGVAVPLATSAGVRELEPPETANPPPSINPKTGLQEFSLQAAQQTNRQKDIGQKRDATAGIASRISDGTLADNAAVQKYIGDNKRDLRSVLGGQGLQNIMFVSGMMRRPANIFSLVSTAPSKALAASLGKVGITDTNSLISLAMASPDVAKFLATKTTRSDLTRTAENQLMTTIRNAIGKSDERDSGSALSAGNRLGTDGPGGQGVGQHVQAVPQMPSTITANLSSDGEQKK